MGQVYFRSRHLAACQAQGVSIDAYASRAGLSAVPLYYQHKRLGLPGLQPRNNPRQNAIRPVVIRRKTGSSLPGKPARTPAL